MITQAAGSGILLAGVALLSVAAAVAGYRIDNAREGRTSFFERMVIRMKHNTWRLRGASVSEKRLHIALQLPTERVTGALMYESAAGYYVLRDDNLDGGTQFIACGPHVEMEILGITTVEV